MTTRVSSYICYLVVLLLHTPHNFGYSSTYKRVRHTMSCSCSVNQSLNSHILSRHNTRRESGTLMKNVVKVSFVIETAS